MKEEEKNSEYLCLLQDYKKEIENEISFFCKDIIKLINTTLIVKSSGSEANVFFLKMKGDYYRYMSEYSINEYR